MAATEKVSHDDETSGETVVYNPLHMFGVLVPRPLRDAQNTFRGDLLDHIVELARLKSSLQKVV